MNTEQVTHDEPSTDERSAQPVSTAARVGDVLPKAMTIRDMCWAFGISRPTFYRFEAAGEYRPFELPRPIGNRRWSGERVQAFLSGRTR